MKMTVASGSVLAAAAAAFVVGTTLSVPSAQADYTVKCFGLNACKGHGACKSTGNACKGKNACKGQGFQMSSKEKCKAKGGSTARG